MDQKLRYIFLICLTSILAKEESQLPLCPTNIDYLPQDLPMHCRMPRSADFGVAPPGLLPPPPPPGALPFPGGPPPVPYPMPMPMPMMPMPQPSHKLPVIVMPFYSPDPDFKKTKDHSSESGKKRKRGPQRRLKKHRRPSPHYTDTDSDTDTDSSDTDLSSDTSSDTSGDRGWWERTKGARKSGRRSNRKHSHKSKIKYVKASKDLLTPVLQYVTKDGYVIFEKQISKNEAKDWLRIKQDNGDGSDERGANEDKKKVVVRSNSKEDIEKETGTEPTTVKPTVRKNHFRHVKANSLLNA